VRRKTDCAGACAIRINAANEVFKLLRRRLPALFEAHFEMLRQAFAALVPRAPDDARPAAGFVRESDDAGHEMRLGGHEPFRLAVGELEPRHWLDDDKDALVVITLASRSFEHCVEPTAGAQTEISRSFAPWLWAVPLFEEISFRPAAPNARRRRVDRYVEHKRARRLLTDGIELHGRRSFCLA
jgi:hypothetical protein